MHIIQFPHPGDEFPVEDIICHRRTDGRYDVPWNTGKHHRRLVEHPGQYADAKGLHDGELRFWTEWEGETLATRLQSKPAHLKGDADSDRRCCLSINGSPLNRVFNIDATRNINKTVADENLVSDVWHEIVKQVTGQGFVLGVHFDWPAQTVI